MNKLEVIVKKIDAVESLHIVSFDFFGVELKMMSLELNEKITVGTKVVLAVKPTHVSFAKNFAGHISVTNQFKARIKGINKGKLLSSAIFEAKYTLIESVFTTESLRKLNLQLHDEFLILIKASDIFIKEIIND
jgi:molybdopterin-binding protein